MKESTRTIFRHLDAWRAAFHLRRSELARKYRELRVTRSQVLATPNPWPMNRR